MRPIRHVRALTPQEKESIHRLYRGTENADLRTRAQMILLSDLGWSPAQIGSVTFMSEDTVLYWIERYEAQEMEGLQDRPRSGRPAKSYTRV